MAKKTKKTMRRRNRLSKRYSKKRLSKRYSKKRLSKRYSKKLSRKKRVSRTKRKMKGGMEATLSGGTAEDLANAAAFGLNVPEYLEHLHQQTEDTERSARRKAEAGAGAQAPAPAPAPAPATLEPAPAPSDDASQAAELGMTLEDYLATRDAYVALREKQAVASPTAGGSPGDGGSPPAPHSPGPSGTQLGIMRHSLRLDNELDKYDKAATDQGEAPPNYKENQNYWENGFNYNTPLANDINIEPPIEGVSLKDRATGRILLSIDRGLRNHDFKCIITSPFTRCLQTAKIVGINLNIPPEKIFINYNLREDDTALALYKPVHKVPDKVWNTLQPYNQELIAEIAKGRIEPYVKQTVNEIFNKYKYLGNVLLITHGDVYNKHGPTIPGTDIGATRLEEAGWAIFDPPNNEIVDNAGDGFFEGL
jgi:broad specificity phosphatase PhoE